MLSSNMFLFRQRFNLIDSDRNGESKDLIIHMIIKTTVLFM